MDVQAASHSCFYYLFNPCSDELTRGRKLCYAVALLAISILTGFIAPIIYYTYQACMSPEQGAEHLNDKNHHASVAAEQDVAQIQEKTTHLNEVYSSFANTKKEFYTELRCWVNIDTYLTSLKNSENFYFMAFYSRGTDRHYGDIEFPWHVVALYQDPESSKYYVLDYDSENTIEHSISEPIELREYLIKTFGDNNDECKFMDVCSELMAWAGQGNDYRARQYCPQAMIIPASRFLKYNDEEKVNLHKLIAFNKDLLPKIKEKVFLNNLYELLYRPTGQCISYEVDKKVKGQARGFLANDRLTRYRAKKLLRILRPRFLEPSSSTATKVDLIASKTSFENAA